MDHAKLAALLEDVALYMELLGENPFKVRAHKNGARIVETTSEDLEKCIRENTLGQIKGIGPGLKQKIEEYSRTGMLSEAIDLKSRIPAGVLVLLKIPGLGPKKAKLVYEKLKIDSVEALETACRENRIAPISGFGEKTQSKILQNLEFLKKQRNRFLFSDAELEAKLLFSYLRSLSSVSKLEPSVLDVAIVGALRRKLEVVKGIGILVSVDSEDLALLPLIQKIKEYPALLKASLEQTEDTLQFEIESGLRCKIKFVEPKEYPFQMMMLTGNKKHIEELKSLAESQNLTLSSTCLTNKESGAEIFCATEKDIYSKLKLDFIEPELREGLGEVEKSQKRELPVLVELRNLKGIFHCHTTASDGVNSLEEMVAGAQALGYEYIGISDHSASSIAYANGLIEERVLSQFAQIEALQSRFKIKIFRGIESDILADGSLDYEPELLRKFDFVIGSVHSGFSQAKEVMTARVLKAIANPYLDFLGHPTGRLLLSRDGFQIDMEQVISAAAGSGVAVEVNASPQRLDMDWRHGTYLKGKKGIVSINPDAHSVASLEDVEYGIGIARKAWLTSVEVINTLSAKDILRSLRRARGSGN